MRVPPAADHGTPTRVRPTQGGSSAGGARHGARARDGEGPGSVHRSRHPDRVRPGTIHLARRGISCLRALRPGDQAMLPADPLTEKAVRRSSRITGAGGTFPWHPPVWLPGDLCIVAAGHAFPGGSREASGLRRSPACSRRPSAGKWKIPCHELATANRRAGGVSNSDWHAIVGVEGPREAETDTDSTGSIHRSARRCDWHRVAVGLGGLSRVWRFDRMSTVVHPATGKVTASYAAVAKHYGVHVVPCPPRRGNRKGVVEKANHSAAQRWWRTPARRHHGRRRPSPPRRVLAPPPVMPGTGSTSTGTGARSRPRTRPAPTDGAGPLRPWRRRRPGRQPDTVGTLIRHIFMETVVAEGASDNRRVPAVLRWPDDADRDPYHAR